MKYDYLPSFPYLRRSLHERSREYILENTIHGVPYFADPTRPVWERIAWLTVTLISTFTAIGIILQCWNKFQEYPTLTVIDTNLESITIDFPQIQFCYDWPELNHSSLNKVEKEFLMKIYNWRWGETVEEYAFEHKKHKGLRDVFHRLGPDCGVIYKNCSFRGVRKPCGEYLEKVVTAAGVCCKFSSQQLGVSEIPRAFVFTPTIYPFRLYVLDKQDSGPQRDERAAELIKRPTLTSILLVVTRSSENLRYLTLSQRQCHYQGPSYNNCELECIARTLLRACACLPWFLGTSGERECHAHEYSCLRREFAELDGCRCTLACDNTAYPRTKVETRADGEPCIIDVPVWPKGLFLREVSYGALDLLVSSGGIASLFIGYSVLTTVELAYYFTLRTYCGAVLESTRGKVNIVKVRPASVKRLKNVPTKPIFYDYAD